MLQTCEARLVLGGSQVDATREHATVPASKLLQVGLGGICKVVDRAIAEKQPEHTRDGSAARRMSRLLGDVEQARLQAAGHLVQVLVGAGARQNLKGLDARCHGQRVARERACLVHGPGRRHHLHDLLLPAVRPDRQTPADHLAHGGHVGGDAPVLLCATVRDAESRHHFIEAEHRAVLGGELAQPLQELELGHDEPRVSHHRLQNDARNVLWVLLEDLLHRLQVVVGGAQCGRGGASWHARGVG
mmetsp:Transcript_45647/g.87311  ORF Transcript_45647/g.87311 Transcript_45647/m.87311 type:complete len:245 (-) Transcript_45647:703-1437(-)